MKLKILLLFIALSGISLFSHAQRLDLFTSHTGQIVNEGSTEQIPYDKTTGFYDYLATGLPPDSTINSQNFYFVYFNVPFEVSEIGIRMISPVPTYVFAEGGDVVTTLYETNKKSDKYFNPWISIERGVSETPQGNAIQFNSWELLGKNDDSSELLPQPSGKHTNSLLRIFQGPYTSGCYRVKFRSAEKGIPEGSYLLQIGSVPGIKRLKMSRTVPGLFEE